MDVANALQFPGDDLRILQSRQKNQTVYFTDFILFLINRTDLACNDKTRLHGCGRCRILYSISFLQHIQPILRRFQLLPQFLPPGRMCEVTCADYLDPLPARPEIQIFRRAVPAGGPGISGMNV